MVRRAGVAILSIGVAVVGLAILLGVLALPSGRASTASSSVFNASTATPSCVAAWEDLPHFSAPGAVVSVTGRPNDPNDPSGEGPTFLCPQDWASIESR